MISAPYFHVNVSQLINEWSLVYVLFYPDADRSFEMLSQEGKIAVVSSVTVFAITSILFFILGFVFRHFCQKGRKTVVAASPTEQPSIPYYDDVVLKQQEEQVLELKDNVAYAQPILSQINN